MNTPAASAKALQTPDAQPLLDAEQAQGLDVTAVMVFGVTAIGLGGFSLISLLGLFGLG